MLAHVEEPPVLHTKYNIQYREAAIFELSKRLNLSNTKKIVLSDYVSYFIKELQESDLKLIDQNYMTLINEKVCMQFSLAAKQEISDIDNLLDLLQ